MRVANAQKRTSFLSHPVVRISQGYFMWIFFRVWAVWAVQADRTAPGGPPKLERRRNPAALPLDGKQSSIRFPHSQRLLCLLVFLFLLWLVGLPFCRG